MNVEATLRRVRAIEEAAAVAPWVSPWDDDGDAFLDGAGGYVISVGEFDGMGATLDVAKDDATLTVLARNTFARTLDLVELVLAMKRPPGYLREAVELWFEAAVKEEES